MTDFLSKKNIVSVSVFSLLSFGVIWLGFTFFEDKNQAIFDQLKIVDRKANKPTKSLYLNLKKISSEHILFGHQDDLAYGVTWKTSTENRSDIKDVCGAFPSVFGWDISKLGQREYNIDSVDFEQMKNWIIDVYEMGGVNTISWHADNFLTGGDSWDVGKNVIKTILPNGEKHEAYKAKLDEVAVFFKSLKTRNLFFKKNIPIVFRPFHEHTGSWFWWGQPHCTPEEYRALWKFTVTYLRDEKKVNNLLYSYSPDVFKDKAHYLECYPGDEFVDVLGLDDYHDVNPQNDPTELTRRLRLLVEMAEEKGKVAAMTETGFEAIPEKDWWTNHLLEHIATDSVAQKIAWILVWRNDRADHHYAPYPDHLSAPDFIQFTKDPIIMMRNQLPKMYEIE